MKAITLGQLRHLLSGAGGILVALGFVEAQDAEPLVDSVMQVAGAVMVAVAHIGSILNKRNSA